MLEKALRGFVALQGFVVGKLPLCLAGRFVKITTCLVLVKFTCFLLCRVLVKFAVAVRGFCASIKFTLRACGVSKFATIKKRKALNFVILGC